MIRMGTPIMIDLYTKPGCHLCEDVEEVLDALAERHPLAVQRIDITRDAEIYSRYWSKIPVVEIGSITLQAPIDPRRLQAVVLHAVRHQR